MNVISMIVNFCKTVRAMVNFDLAQANRALEREVESLQREKDIANRISYRDEVYYLRTNEGSEDGPFCSLCYDKRKLLVRLQREEWNQPRCPNCGLPQGPKFNPDVRHEVNNSVPLSQLAEMLHHET